MQYSDMLLLSFATATLRIKLAQPVCLSVRMKQLDKQWKIFHDFDTK
jgi:hypothetical protein